MNGQKRRTMHEEWRPVVGYEGFYEVSSYGRVRSYQSTRWGIVSTPRILRPAKTKKGYLAQTLTRDGQKKTFPIHRLVMAAFVGISDLQVNHKDGDKANNYFGNLEYCTNAENQRHSIDVLGHRVATGEDAPKARISNQQVAEMRQLLIDGVKGQVIADMYGVGKGYVSAIRRGRSRVAPEDALPNGSQGENHH